MALIIPRSSSPSSSELVACQDNRWSVLSEFWPHVSAGGHAQYRSLGIKVAYLQNERWESDQKGHICLCVFGLASIFSVCPPFPQLLTDGRTTEANAVFQLILQRTKNNRNQSVTEHSTE